MSDDDESVDWRKLREFADVDLTKSFVLSWQAETGTLYIDVDVHLLPNHPFYEKPRPAEKVCIRPALIEFPYCQAVRSDGHGESTDIVMAAETLGLGAIDGLRRLADGRYEIRGEFGTVQLDAERPVLRLKSP